MLFHPIAAKIPMSAIAGLILYVAWWLISLTKIIKLSLIRRVEVAIAATILLSGVLGPPGFAIYSQPALVIGAPNESLGRRSFSNASLSDLAECPSIRIIRFMGPIFFDPVDFITQELLRFLWQGPE
jgi:MFS superfamily sulfate permease-like transporter